MSSTRRWSVPHGRVAVSAVLAAVATFLICGGVGMASWLVGAIGLAMFAGSVGLYAVSALNSRAYPVVPATARVPSAPTVQPERPAEVRGESSAGNEEYDAAEKDGESFDPDMPDDLRDDDLVSVVQTPDGGRLIELDVMSPSVLRWSAPIPTDGEAGVGAVGTGAHTATDMPAVGAPATQRRRPSPRPRPVADETIVSISFGEPVAGADIVDGEVVDAEPVSDGPFDQLADAEALADAYLAATPPPGTSQPGHVRSVTVTLFVTDLSRSIVFYRDLLGFQEIDAGHGSAMLESGDARIILRRVSMAPVDRRLVHLLLDVPDVNAAYEDLRTRGISFTHHPRPVSQYEQMELWSAAFRDPDGHGIAVTHWQPKR